MSAGKEIAVSTYSSAQLEMIAWQESLRRMLAWFLDPRMRALDQDGDHVASMIGDHLDRAFRLADPSRFVTRRLTSAVRPFEPEGYLAHDPGYLSPVVELYSFVNSRMKPYVSQFVLHGSMATLDYCKGWSDLDTFVVVRKETFHTTVPLLELRRCCFEAYDYLLQIDPLQHHGLIVVTEYDLEYYPSVYMPPAVFDHALSLLSGAGPMHLHVRDSQEEAMKGIRAIDRVLESAVKTGVLRHHAYRGEYLRAGYENAQNGMYQFKYLLALAMSLPALFLNGLGQSCYKRESFGRCEGQFGDHWAIIEKASEVRRLWPDKEAFRFTGNAIPRWVQAIVGPEYFKETFALVRAMLESLRSCTRSD